MNEIIVKWRQIFTNGITFLTSKIITFVVAPCIK